jgi:8-oxo-dGTP pyrophosphatase MutT (NUDIX family)
MKERLKKALSQRRKHQIVDPGRISSAVLVPIYRKNGEYHLLFIKRTERVKVHKGQISFPGGAYEEQDKTLSNTALRESAEEIGLPVESAEMLGELDDIATMGTGYIISPYVAAIPWPLPLKVDETETEEIIEIPISELLNEDSLREDMATLENGQVISTYFYHYKDRVVWGATARILKQFLDIYTQVIEGAGKQKPART